MPKARHGDQELLHGALEAFERVTGLRPRLDAPGRGAPAPEGPDARLLVEAGKRKHRYAVEVKAVDRLVALGAIRNRFDLWRQPGLLITRHVTPEMAAKCRQLDLEFIDTAGNAYLNREGLFVFVTGKRPADTATGVTARAFNAAGLRLIFVLLCRPEAVQRPYRELAPMAGVAVGVVGRAFAELRARRFLVGGEEPPERRLVNRGALLDAWVTNYPHRLRPKLNARRFRAPDADWWTRFDARAHHAYWGGEVAAAKTTQHLRPAAFTLYTRTEPRDIVLGNRFRLDPAGDVEILRAFWDEHLDPDATDVVPPVLAYADLLATLDPRNFEAAKILRDRHIAPALDPR